VAVSDTTLNDIWRTHGLDKAEYVQTPIVVSESENFRIQIVTSVAVVDHDLITAKSTLDWGTSPPTIVSEFTLIPVGTICHMADEYRENM